VLFPAAQACIAEFMTAIAYINLLVYTGSCNLFFFGVFLNKTNKRPCHYIASTSVLHRCVHDVDCLHKVVSVYRISSSDFVFAYF